MLYKKIVILCFYFFVLKTMPACCQVRLPQLVSDSMVLQRDTKIKIWGWAGTGEKVTVSFNKKAYVTTAGADGKWLVTLPAIKAGGPYQMDIDASNHLSVKNILIGEVWLCSGQSNMELPMDRVKDKYPAVIAGCANTNIRQFNISTRYAFEKPLTDFDNSRWQAANTKSILNFTAVGYFFAKALYEKYHVPVGIIKCAVGGSPAEAWLSEDALQAFPDYLATAKKFKSAAYIDSIKKADSLVNENWYKAIWQTDKGLQEPVKWYDTNYNAAAWKTMQVPNYWDEQGLPNTNGVVWFRKEINVPASMTGVPAMLFLGTMIDRDSSFVNGIFVGTTGYQYPPRKYALKAGVLKEGKNIITIRLINYAGRGGFNKEKPYQLAAGGKSIDLQGQWQYQLGTAGKPIAPTTTIHYQPLSLFNGMIAPILNYAVKGVIWYQGESNTGRAKEYRQLFHAVITDWRNKFGQGNFPFLYVQLANYMQPKKEPGESQWAALREAQLKTLAVPNTAMVVTTDIGEWNDIHPLNKEDVGNRLALAAQKTAYGNKNIIASGPLYRSMKISGDKIIIGFSNVGNDLVSKGEKLRYFSIAGADKKFIWAEAIIKDNQVVVWNDNIKEPVAVRYAWADDPEGANLYNKAGLPASAFRTDDDDNTRNTIAIDNSKGLKDYYAAYFPIGVAVSPGALKTDEAGLIIKNFNSLTPENAMKWEAIHPKENEYNFKDADSIIAFAQRNNMKVRGHNLCWYNQNPDWLFKNADGSTVSKAVLLQRLKEHINTVVKRYKGTIYAWDVVNEAISDKPGEYLRNTPWLQICGEEYIARAFEYAHEADPDAVLFYNDYNEISAVKREKIYTLLKSLIAAGVPINGVGLQGHWAVNEPSMPQLDSTLKQFAELGLKVQVTELDISVYNKEHNARDRRPEDADTTFSGARENRQMEIYKMCFELFRKYKAVLSGVTFWNISDRHSWLDDFPVKGRKDHPLLFDANLKPKKAFWEVVKF